jgi:hypothetical protein
MTTGSIITMVVAKNNNDKFKKFIILFVFTSLHSFHIAYFYLFVHLFIYLPSIGKDWKILILQVIITHYYHF